MYVHVGLRAWCMAFLMQQQAIYNQCLSWNILKLNKPWYAWELSNLSLILQPHQVKDCSYQWILTDTLVKTNITIRVKWYRYPYRMQILNTVGPACIIDRVDDLHVELFYTYQEVNLWPLLGHSVTRQDWDILATMINYLLSSLETPENQAYNKSNYPTHGEMQGKHIGKHSNFSLTTLISKLARFSVTHQSQSHIQGPCHV